jgi:hypothetical protein
MPAFRANAVLTSLQQSIASRSDQRIMYAIGEARSRALLLRRQTRHGSHELRASARVARRIRGPRRLRMPLTAIDRASSESASHNVSSRSVYCNSDSIWSRVRAIICNVESNGPETVAVSSCYEGLRQLRRKYGDSAEGCCGYDGAVTIGMIVKDIDTPAGTPQHIRVRARG